MRQSACLVFNPMTVNNFVSLFNCTPVGRASVNDGPDIKLFILVDWGRRFFVCCLAHRGSTVGFILLQCSSGVVRHPRDLQVSIATRFCRVLIFVSSLYMYLSVIYFFPVMTHWWVRKHSSGPNNSMFSALTEAGARLGSRKTGLSLPPPQYFNTDRSKAVLLLWFLTVTCSCCPYLYFGSAMMLVTYFVTFR